MRKGWVRVQVHTPVSDWIAASWPMAAVAGALLCVYALHLHSAWAAARGRADAYSSRRRRLLGLERRLRPGQPPTPTLRALRAALDRERARLVDEGILR